MFCWRKNEENNYLNGRISPESERLGRSCTSITESDQHLQRCEQSIQNLGFG